MDPRPAAQALTPADAPGPDRWGLALGVSAYLLWGFLPLYFPLLEPSAPIEVVAHRIVWSLLFCAVALLVTRGGRTFAAAVRDLRTLVTLATAAVLVATNWLVFVHGVLSGHTVDAALGYYINPLVTVALAVLVLGERMRRAQWVALGIGALAVGVITVGLGRLPWVALALAGTFGLYGLIKNRVGRTVPAVTSLAVETAVLTPVALVYLLWLGSVGLGTFAQHGTPHALALAGTGVITAVPLLLFGAAARRLPLSVIGLLQYAAPTMQFLVGVLVFREEMPALRWWGFGLVWLALVILTTDGLRTGRLERIARRTTPAT
ncbi:EamA family transporter RarD [Actinotalea sp. C106]|uniref:EamA family transporter RarD n=1 Tax=Actinotalea sp. C106 TaxID=2908644 RepID=UPI0020292A4E|nr:EamA family transporter RarD [Actinotalea sp. C106]